MDGFWGLLLAPFRSGKTVTALRWLFNNESSTDIWHAICTAVRSACSVAQIKGEQVTSLGFAVTWYGKLVLCAFAIDSDGEPVTVSLTHDSEAECYSLDGHRAVKQSERINLSKSPVLEYSVGVYLLRCRHQGYVLSGDPFPLKLHAIVLKAIIMDDDAYTSTTSRGEMIGVSNGAAGRGRQQADVEKEMEQNAIDDIVYCFGDRQLICNVSYVVTAGVVVGARVG
ncbi:hypothetical protein SASPL_157570 [Salvia splendens]|uniref:Uncharacterized protein n=1 Tax=Salvia splendens TaxID=180675 RepID=A0A8X8YV90_SALSN|nr:hypothetical protein SASPL_157570 [Salvia splendens]